MTADIKTVLTDAEIDKICQGFSTWMFPVETQQRDCERAMARAIEARVLSAIDSERKEEAVSDIKTSIFLQNLHHAYAQTDGTYNFPNSREGDMLKRAKTEIEELRAVLSAIDSERKDAERWRKARVLFQAWEIKRAAENMIGGIPDEDECTKADNAIDAASKSSEGAKP